MPRKRPDVPIIAEPEFNVDVTIQQSNLKSGDEQVSYGTIRRKKVTVRSILAEMEKHSQLALSKELMFYVAAELSQRMMQKLREGCAVELLDFGTIFPTMRGSVQKTDTPSQLRAHFDVSFTPSKEARAAVKKLVVGRIQKVPKQHYILFAEDVLSKNTERNTLTSGKVARIRGKAVKLGGAKSGLYAARVGEDWNGVLPDQKKWIRLEHIITNLPSRLEFFTELPADSYVLIVETSLSAGGKPLKQSVTVTSEVVRVTGDR